MPTEAGAVRLGRINGRWQVEQRHVDGTRGGRPLEALVDFNDDEALRSFATPA